MTGFDQVLPAEIFDILNRILLEWAAADPAHICLSEKHLQVSLPHLSLPNLLRFTLMSHSSQVLLFTAEVTELPNRYRMRLSLAADPIIAFLQTIQPLLPPPSKRRLDPVASLQTKLNQAFHPQTARSHASHALTPELGSLPAALVWQLLAAVSSEQSQVLPATAISCQPLVSAAMVRQVEQERLLHQVVSQIRQSLELPVILNTTVAQLRPFLQVDQLLLLQFSQPMQPSQDIEVLSGWVHHEALAEPYLVLERPYAYGLTHQDYHAYQQGHSLVIADIETAYAHAPTILNQLQQRQVKASLSTPIRVQGQLWGVLIAHQCQQNPAHNQWQDNQQTFLKQIAEHLAVAIQQAQLYAQLQLQAQTLEQRVIERTQALQEALIATQSANRTKSDFLATMSHELRTPLTCVIGMSATLLRWSLGPLNDKQRSYLKTIHDSGEHLLELINDILDLSQVEAGRVALNLSEFSLSQLSRQCLQAMREKAITAGVELKVEILTGERDQFIADQRRCRQILFNLLSNAIKFTPEGGQVTLRVWLENKSAILQVEDTGIGIPEEKKSLLFQKFQQLDTSYRRSYEGLGLGLALTKQLVEMHHGWIEVESVEGKGSIFTVELPLQQIPSEAKGLAGADAASAGRIALIEDNEETATLICELLTAAGFQVIWMIEPSTAVDQIQLLQPLLAIISANLAGMDGYAMIRRLRLQLSTQGTKILLLTPTINAEQRQQYHSADADAYLNLPIQPEHLLQKIAQLLAQNLSPK
jgi:two-component system, sensor histidine kinase and response regulator